MKNPKIVFHFCLLACVSHGVYAAGHVPLHANTINPVEDISRQTGQQSDTSKTTPPLPEANREKLDFSFIQGGAGVNPEAWEQINRRFIPGTYFLDVIVNGKNPVKKELNILPEDAETLCFPVEWLKKADIFISEEFFKGHYQESRSCWVLSGAPGVVVDLDMASQTLKLSFPQAALTDIPANTDWNYGNTALRVNYSANSTVNEVSKTSYGAADIKANLAGWVLSSSATMSDKQSELVVLNASRAMQSLHADFTVGKTFVGDDLLGSVSIIGASLKSNNSMRSGDFGYSPEFRGIAKSASRVTLIQSGSTIYSEPVPTGPFVIRDVPLLSSGDVEMIITGQQGDITRQTFPLTVMRGMINPGKVEYSFSAGRRDTKDNALGSRGNVLSANIGYGLNFLTLRAGSLLHKQYQGITASVTTNLGAVGGVSFGGAMSRAGYDNGQNEQGAKVQSTWSKTLEATSTGLFISASRQLSPEFTDFTSFSPSRREPCIRDSQDANNILSGRFTTYCEKGLRYSLRDRSQRNEFSLGFSQPVRGFFSAGLNGWRRDYWNSDVTETGMTLNLSTQISAASLNLGGSISQARETHSRRNNWSASASISIPFSVFDRRMSSYTTVTTGTQGGASVANGVSGALSEKLYYTLGTGRDNNGDIDTNMSASYSGNRAMLGMSLYQRRSGTTGSAAVSGSVLAVPAARSIILSRTMSDTVAVANVGNIPGVRFSSGSDTTDGKGNVVIPLTGYRMNRVTVDSSTLPQTIEMEETSLAVVPSANAVVYMPFPTVRVHRYLLQVRRVDGTFIPGGTWAKGRRGAPLGFVAQNGVLMINATEHPGDVSLDTCRIPAGKILENEKIQEVICE
ncbi:PefC/AfrB family outer membrane usher protein [Citrobacter portucalensis]|uniref:PefC/AfrB family outer membrane usher protein n=1 Tax=Citrobacter portucalensis TaxID=1639133 RepID=UPI00226BA103|nr:PefC/AfrB family outer membrane usher protein [Citrobacter portucalensis]MCX8980937.1 PefC/AfrB family outer membrane usher protein [Citrobacter portucalensis]